jgi:hypothetical protein
MSIEINPSPGLHLAMQSDLSLWERWTVDAARVTIAKIHSKFIAQLRAIPLSISQRIRAKSSAVLIT